MSIGTEVNSRRSKANAVVQEAIDAAIRDTGEIGMQVAAYLDGELVVDTWGGLADETTGSKVDGDTLFPVFSVTKSIASTALNIQIDRGLLHPGVPIAEYWPEFAAHGKHHATVYDALTHRLGIPLMPSGVTPELMCDWDWMTKSLAAMQPLFEPGTKLAYHSYTIGWIVGGFVRRTDPKRRPFGQFVQDEVCKPLGIDNLWIGIPDGIDARIAKLTNMRPAAGGGDPEYPAVLLAPLAIPPAVYTTQDVFGRADVRRACIPAAGGIMNARSAARVLAMLAGGGELDGVRLLSKERVAMFPIAGPPVQFDPVWGLPRNVGLGGYQLSAPIGNGRTHVAFMPGAKSRRAFGNPGAGGSIVWADPDARLGVAIFHNRMVRFNYDPDENPVIRIGEAVFAGLGL